MTRSRHETVATDRQLRAAAAALAGQCEVMSRILKRNGIPPRRNFTADFSGLARIVVGQQLSAQSAAAIWMRVETSLETVAADAVMSRNDAELSALGLSGGKIRTLRALARAVIDDGLDFATLNRRDDQGIIDLLTRIHGIGPWTADIYLLFALARRDAFAPGDLALQLAVQHHFKLDVRPSSKELEKIAERWRPSRAVAARLLWADYAFARRALLAGAPKSIAKNSRSAMK